MKFLALLQPQADGQGKSATEGFHFEINFLDGICR